MNNKTFVRTLLLNSDNKKFIKSLDERSLDSYIDLLSKEKQKDNQNHYTIVDFSPVIEHLHRSIEVGFRNYRNEEIKLHHATTYNNWLRFKDIPADKEAILSNQANKIMDEAEWTLNAIIASITPLKSSFYWATEDNKPQLFESIMGDTDVFIESILCQIHAAIIFSPILLEKSNTIPQHLIFMHETLQDLLRNEAGVHPDLTLAHDNIIEQSCMENIEVDPELIINLTDANTSVEKIIQRIYSAPIQDIENYGNGLYSRQKILTWHKASINKTKRVMILIEKIRKIISIMDLVGKIKNHEYDFSRDSTDVANVENEIKLLTIKN